MMAAFVDDLPGEINVGFDKTAKEFSDKVVASVLDRDQRIEFNKEVAAQTQATVISLIQTAKNKIKAKPSAPQTQVQQKIPEPLPPLKPDPPKVEAQPLKVLKTRKSDSLSTDTRYRGAAFKFPEQVSFDRHIVGFQHKPGSFNGVNYIMSDGTRSQLELKVNNGSNPWSDVQISADAVVRKVVIHGNFEFGGVQFFDDKGVKILEAGYIANQKLEIVLAEGERLLGIESFHHSGDLIPR